MTKITALLALTGLAALSAANTATFDDLGFAPNYDYEDGAHLNGPTFVSDGLGFSNDDSTGYFEGFAYSRVRDTTTPGFTNEFAAYAGAAHSGTNYGVSFDDGATITLPAGQRILGMQVTNTTYAALSTLR